MVNEYLNSDERKRMPGGEIMRQSELNQYMGYTPKGTNCSAKRLYLFQPDAEIAAREHNRQFICQDMGAYWCELHQGWHIGHSNKRWRSRQMLLNDISWFTLWESKSKR